MPKPTAEQILVNDQLDLLVTLNRYGLDPDVSDSFRDAADDIKDRYLEARAIADEVDGNKARREQAEKVCASIAKGLPDMVKGALSAAKAFQRGDAMSGSASVMDMCAAAAPMIGAILAAAPLLSAAGPVGMLAGAVFSIIGQLLTFFGPKQESMIDQIENLLLGLSADSELQNIKAAHDDISNFSKSLKLGVRLLTRREKNPDSQAGGAFLPSILQTPLKDAKDLDALRVVLGAFKVEIKAFSPINSVTMNHFWGVKNWLENPERQDLDKWPEVLCVWCKSYSDLMTANLTIYGVLESSELQQRLKEVGVASQGDSKSVDSVRELILSLMALETARRAQWSACGDTAMKFLNRITPVARKRGLFAVAYNNNYLYVGSSAKILGENKFVGIYEHCHRMSISAPAGGLGDPAARYDAWVTDSYNRESLHLKLDPRDRKFSNGNKIIINREAPEANELGGLLYTRFVDWCAVPESGAGSRFSVYGALDWAEGGGIEHWIWDAGAQTFARENWRPTMAQRMTQVRIAARPTLVPNDPDRSEELDKTVEAGPIIYGALQNTKEIFVVGTGFQGYVRVPMGTYSGVATDANYLWMYGQDGFACASHASVIRCLNGKRPMPYWMGNGQPKPIHHVIDLSSCADGTLLVSSPGELSTSVFHVDFTTPGVGEGERLSIERWDKLPAGGGANQVQKLPIFGWSVLESLKSDLSPHTAR